VEEKKCGTLLLHRVAERNGRGGAARQRRDGGGARPRPDSLI
jgi:hypothetical protein